MSNLEGKKKKKKKKKEQTVEKVDGFERKNQVIKKSENISYENQSNCESI